MQWHRPTLVNSLNSQFFMLDHLYYFYFIFHQIFLFNILDFIFFFISTQTWYTLVCLADIIYNDDNLYHSAGSRIRITMWCMQTIDRWYRRIFKWAHKSKHKSEYEADTIIALVVFFIIWLLKARFYVKFEWILKMWILWWSRPWY